MPTTDQDIRALTYLAKRIRDETHGAGRWDEAGIAAKLAELKGQHLGETVEKVLRHAQDKDAKTPGAILRPFLPDAPAQTARVVPFDPAAACDVCERPADRHGDLAGHEFVSRLEYRRSRTTDPERVAADREYARQAVGESKATTHMQEES